MKNEKIPNPGSPEAVALGCSCPRMDNCNGAGVGGNGVRFGWWRDAGCTVHIAATPFFTGGFKKLITDDLTAASDSQETK